MVRLVLAVVVEILVGTAIGGAVLAVLIPVLGHFGLVEPGDLTGAVIIIGALVCSVGLMILRPGSALNRHFER